MRFAALLLVALTACVPMRFSPNPDLLSGGAALARAPKPRPIKTATVGNVAQLTVIPNALFAADTLLSTVQWVLPVNDGKGPLDSLKVNLNNISGPGALTVKFLPPLPTQTVFRQAIPFADASWTITAQICVYRGTGANSSTCVTASAPFTYALIAPPPVTGASVTNTKVP